MVSMILFSEADQTIVGSENTKEMFGYTTEECMGNKFSILLTPTYRELAFQLVWECLSNKKPMLVEGQSKNDTKFPISMLVTEAQQEISGHSVLIASIFPVHTEYGVITVNKSGTVIAANSRIEKMFEKPVSEIVEKHIKTIIPLFENESEIQKGMSKQVIGTSSNGNQLSLWLSIENDTMGIGDLFHMKLEHLDPDMDMEVVLQLDSTMTITDCSRYFLFTLLGYLNSEILGENIHNLIDAKDIDSRVNIPVEKNSGRKRMKTSLNTLNFVASPYRIMVRNKAGFLNPFNMQISPFNSKSDRFSIYLKPTQSAICKPPDEVLRSFSDYSIQLQVDNGECGSSTSVFSAVNKTTGETRAIKILNKRLIDENQKRRAINEFKIASTFDHPNIIKYLDQFETDNYLCTIMEFGKDGSLETYTRKKTKLSEEEAHKYFSHLVDGLGYMHDRKAVHGDIKLNNAVLLDGVCKLIDFNMSKRADEQEVEVLKRTTFCGTSLYIAPEMVLNKDYEGQKADIWSLGVCLFVMVTGDYPFDSIAASLQNKITIPSYVSAPLAELMRGILTFDPKKRYGIEQIQNHPWIKNDSNSNNCWSHVPVI